MVASRSSHQGILRSNAPAASVHDAYRPVLTQGALPVCIAIEDPEWRQVRQEGDQETCGELLRFLKHIVSDPLWISSCAELSSCSYFALRAAGKLCTYLY